MAIFDEKIEIREPRRIPRERCKGVHCVDLGESFPTSIYLQKSASIQPRTSPSKFGGKYSILFNRVLRRGSAPRRSLGSPTEEALCRLRTPALPSARWDWCATFRILEMLIFSVKMRFQANLLHIFHDFKTPRQKKEETRKQLNF